MTRKLKVANFTYDNGVITAFYYYYAYQYPDYRLPNGRKPVKVPFRNHFHAIKKADGTVGYLME